MASLGPVKFLTIHTTATPEGLDCTAQQIAAMDIRKFGQESYHHIIKLGIDRPYLFIGQRHFCQIALLCLSHKFPASLAGDHSNLS